MLIFHMCVNKYSFHRPAIMFCKVHYKVLLELNILKSILETSNKVWYTKNWWPFWKKFNYAKDMYKTSTELQLSKLKL